MWYTGIDPMSGEEVQTARYLRDREVQRALMQFFKPENWFDVRDALVAAGRQDLIGGGCDARSPPPRRRKPTKPGGNHPPGQGAVPRCPVRPRLAFGIVDLAAFGPPIGKSVQYRGGGSRADGSGSVLAAVRPSEPFSHPG